MTLIRRSLAFVLAATAALLTLTLPAQRSSAANPGSTAPSIQVTPVSDLPEYNADGSVTYQLVTYADIHAWQDSKAFRDGGFRCGTPSQAELLAATGPLKSAGDCSLSETILQPWDDPISNPVCVIPVVVHNIEDAAGIGQLDDALIRSQLEVLNEDFRALPTGLGGAGVDTRIEFRLADVDPAGNATTGIRHVVDDTLFAERTFPVQTMTNLNWDPDRYLNIYVNNYEKLGVSTFPQLEAGNPADGVVVQFRYFGRDNPLGGDYDQGRTATHEVGHYLGLLHVFEAEGSCGIGGTEGDLISDTNAQRNACWNCPSLTHSCGSSDPVENYMNYTDDTCMDRFTLNQARRMRCALNAFRENLCEYPPSVPALAVTLDCQDNYVGSLEVQCHATAVGGTGGYTFNWSYTGDAPHFLTANDEAFAAYHHGCPVDAENEFSLTVVDSTGATATTVSGPLTCQDP